MNSKGQKAILFVKHGIIFAPECVKGDNLFVIEEVGKDCYREVIEKFPYKNVTKISYLKGKVIREVF